MSKPRLGALAALLAAPVPALAAPPTDPALDADLRCFTAVSFKMGQEDDEAGSKYIYPFVYYAGRIDGRQPGFDYSGQIIALLNRPGFDEAAMSRELARCEAEFKSRLDYLDEMGKSLGSDGE